MKKGKILLTLAAAGLLGIGSFSLGAGAANNSSSPTSFLDGATTQQSDHPLGRLIRAQIGRWITLRSELDLTSDQKQQIAGILKQHKSEIVQAIQPVVDKRRALREAVLAQNPDEKTIRADADDLGKAIGDAAVLASQLKQQVAPILTDQQKQQLGDFRSQSDSAVDNFFAKMAGGQ